MVPYEKPILESYDDDAFTPDDGTAALTCE